MYNYAKLNLVFIRGIFQLLLSQAIEYIAIITK